MNIENRKGNVPSTKMNSEFARKMSQKYSMALCAYDNRIVLGNFESIKILTIPEYNYLITNNYFAMELFLKLIIDSQNKKIDSTKGHSIKALWKKLNDDTRKKIEEKLGQEIDTENLPVNVYTSVRYFWDNNKDSYVLPTSFLEVLKSFYEETSPSLAIKIIKRISVKQKIEGTWIEI